MINFIQSSFFGPSCLHKMVTKKTSALSTNLPPFSAFPLWPLRLTESAKKWISDTLTSSVTLNAACRHLNQKWRPINYSFVCTSISPLCLIFTSKLFFILNMLTKQRWLTNMQTNKVYSEPFCCQARPALITRGTETLWIYFFGTLGLFSSN